MHAQIQDFASANGLPPTLAPKLEAFIVELVKKPPTTLHPANRLGSRFSLRSILGGIYP